ncbi:DUF1127 domain-containing protein [Pseudomonas sp. GV071]|uniref:DUF1127 domain-containing protein n=1 Tax=Pseudomonas sp. GV071 TaxID=2135754 RepID=UPI000D3A3083|nr:DUF1127 domain-containing protein [Pseudomonas sp. GV071]PTQ68848.1 uncharacterized protein YjiS (DUF1127 family) [Pseudomonas sp. GV071]
MNGLSDVRLTLGQQELVGKPTVAKAVANRPTVRKAPMSRWAAFWRRLTTRRALLNLTDVQLTDIGITRAEANHEALRPFWTL